VNLHMQNIHNTSSRWSGWWPWCDGIKRTDVRVCE